MNTSRSTLKRRGTRSGRARFGTAVPAGAAIIAMVATSLGTLGAAPTPVGASGVAAEVVAPGNQYPTVATGWGLGLDSGTAGTGTATLEAGPGTPPVGTGSLRLAINAGATTTGVIAAASRMAGAKLSEITGMSYATYRQVGAASLAATLQLNVDYDLTDSTTSWQGRLVFEPYMTGTPVSTGTWQTWSPLTAAHGWWTSSATVKVNNANLTSTCTQSAPCTWAQVLAAFPKAGIHVNPASAGVGLKAGSAGSWPGFIGNADALSVTYNNGADTLTADFEPNCTTACYVNGTTGVDTNPGTATWPKKTIQAAIDQASPGATISIAPGTYNETASGRGMTTDTGSYQYGLFLPPSKSGITLQGTDASWSPITSHSSIAATVNTNATNNFGYSGIFVAGDHDTIRGLRIGPNTAGDEKTIEVIGDAFTLHASEITPDGGVYMGDMRYDDNATPANFADDTSHITSYSITNNHFLLAGPYIANGAGVTGPVSGRVITGNTIDGSTSAPIGFAGPTPNTGWLNYPVGGAIVTGNTFTDPTATRYVQSWGTTQLNSQFDWASIFANNTYPHAVVATTDGNPAHLRPYTAGDFVDIHRVGAVIQNRIDNAQAGDTIVAKAGTFDEALSISKALTIRGANSGVSPNSGPRAAETVVRQLSGTSRVFDVSTTSPVTIDGLTARFTGTDTGGQVTVGGLLFNTAAGNQVTFSNNIVSSSSFNNALLYLTSAATATVTDNLFTGIEQVGAGATGIFALWGSPSTQAVLDVERNVFQGLTETAADGTPAMNVNNAGGTIDGNTFANLHQYGILIADELANLAITGNTFTGISNDTPGSSSNRGSGVRTFAQPTFSGPVTVSGNTFTNVHHAVRVANDGSPAALNSNFTVTRNDLSGASTSTMVSVASGTTGTLDATCNWWGSASGPTVGQYDGSVTVTPYLKAGAPLASAACGENTTLTYGGATSGTNGSAVSVSATLTGFGGAPLAGRTVTFTIGSQAVNATTNASGVASTSIVSLNAAAGAGTVLSSFAGVAPYDASSDSDAFTVTDPTTLTLGGATAGTNGTSVTVTGTLTSIHQPGGVSGRTVSFTLGSQTATAVTNASGVATWIFTLNQPAGAATVAAGFTAAGGYTASTASKPFAVTDPTTLVNTVAASATVGQALSVSATLTSVNLPGGVAGKTVTFTLGTQTTSAVTNASGVATGSITVDQAAVPVNLVSAFTAAGGFSASTDSDPVTLNKASTALVLTNPGAIQAGKSGTLKATLTNASFPGPVAGRSVLFGRCPQGATLLSQCTFATATTDSTGVATLNYTGPDTLGPWTVSAGFTADASYFSSNAPNGTLTVFGIPTATAIRTSAGKHRGAYVVSTTLKAWTATYTSSYPVSGQTVRFYRMASGADTNVAGATYVGQAVTDTNGNASVLYRMDTASPPATGSKLAFVAVYAGLPDGTYGPSQSATKVTTAVARRRTILSGTGVSSGGSVALNLTLKEQNLSFLTSSGGVSTSTTIIGAAVPSQTASLRWVKANGTVFGSTTMVMSGSGVLATTLVIPPDAVKLQVSTLISTNYTASQRMSFTL